MTINHETSIYFNVEKNRPEISLKDSTEWPVDGANRNQYCIIFSVAKINSSNQYNLELVDGSVIYNYNQDFLNTERSESKFIIKEDGYHKSFMAALPVFPSNVNNDIYYDPQTEKIFVNSFGEYSEISLNELINSEIEFSKKITNLPLNPNLSIKLDEISLKYSKGRSGSSDSDFRLWNLCYIQLYAALLSFDKEAFMEYDKKVKIANLFK